MKRVLVIEDHTDTLDYYRTSLESLPLDVVAVEKGADGLRLFAESLHDAPFDLVVTDLVLAKDSGNNMSGIEVARQVRSQCISCKIVVITGRDDILDDTDARRLGLSGLWEKPVRNFRSCIQEILQMPEEVNQERRSGFFRRAAADPEARVSVVKGWPTWLILMCILGLQVFSVWRSPRLFTAVATMDKKLDGAVTTGQLPQGYRVLVPTNKTAFKVLKDGSPRLTIQGDPKDAAAFASIASSRGVPFYVCVTRTP